MIEILVRRRVLTTVLVLIALIVGSLSYGGLGLRRFPKVDFPVVTVITRYEGASPAEVETEITKRIEDVVSTVSGIETISSSSQQGLSLVYIEFGLEEDVDIKAIDVRNKIDQIIPLLPEDADDPIPQKFEIGQFPIMDLAVYGPQDRNELYRIADEDLKPQLTQVAGVADIMLTGGQEREIHVLVDARKLRKYGVPIGAIVAALRAANMDVPAGHITQPGREYVIRTPGRFTDVAEVANVRIPTESAGYLTVGDLAQVVDTYEEQRTAARFNGQDAIILSVQARTDANEVEVADGITAAIPRLVEMLPAGAKLDVARDTSEFIRGALNNVFSNMLIGICLTAVVLYLFLKSGRGTFIAAVVMPAAVVIAFIGLKVSGFTLNIISLTGLAITIGMLVNNAILILENVTRFMDRGMLPMEAAVEGTKDIALAILSSTATNLVVFLPIAFMGEIIGRFFRELGLTVAYATIVSLLVSYSLTPMMCGLMLQANHASAKKGPAAFITEITVGWLADLWRAGFEVARGLYMSTLDWCLHHRWKTMVLALIAAVCSLAVFGLVGAEFMPPSDEGRFVVSIEMPIGTPLAETDRVVRQVEEIVKRVPHMVSYTVQVGMRSGGGSGRTEGVDLAQVSVSVVDRAEREATLDDIMNGIRPSLAAIPSAKILASKEEGGPHGAPISIEVIGDNLADLQRVSEQIMAIVRATPGTAGVTSSWESGQPEIRIRPDRDALMRYRIDVSDLGAAVRSYVEGSTASQFLDGDENYDIVVKLREQDRQWASEIGSMFVASPTGQMVTIDQLADVVREPGSTLILRKDRSRLITVSSNLTGERPQGKVQADIAQAIEQSVSVPPGVRINYGGETEMIQKNFRELFKAMATAAVLTFLCVAGIIESFGFAVIIIMALPVCLIGVSLAMFVAGVTVNVFSLMAMIMLVGMVVNNAIIVVDYAMRQERSGMSAMEAVREACSVRFRMILMANLTTIVALIPLSLGLGFGGEVFRPLAVVQMGGIFAAAALSLLVIPAVYVLVRGRRTTGLSS